MGGSDCEEQCVARCLCALKKHLCRVFRYCKEVGMRVFQITALCRVARCDAIGWSSCLSLGVPGTQNKMLAPWGCSHSHLDPVEATVCSTSCYVTCSSRLKLRCRFIRIWRAGNEKSKVSTAFRSCVPPGRIQPVLCRDQRCLLGYYLTTCSTKDTYASSFVVYAHFNPACFICLEML